MSLAGRTAIYGGSFNPPHMGHQMACLYLLEALGADGVWLVPARRHPFGKALVDFRHRVAMAELLARPFAGHVQVSRVEDDTELSGRTFDTLVRLRHDHPERHFALVIGADIVPEIGAWYRWPDIESMMPVTVLGRSGYAAAGAPVLLPEVSSGDIRERLGRRESIAGLVPTSVADYIEEHVLYRA